MEIGVKYGRCPNGIFYRMKQGDTLEAVAGKYGLDLGTLLLANPFLDPRRMVVGQVIVLPVKEERGY